MASFDYFTQPQGPTVPISLFGEAAQAGTNVGKTVGTPFSNIVEGGFKGVQEGLSFKSEIQNQQIRQNQIDQLPVTNQIQEEQLKQQQIQNQINQRKLDEAKAIDDLKTQNNFDSLQIQSQASKLNADKATNDQVVQLGQLMQTGTPAQRLQAAMSDQYGLAFSKYPQAQTGLYTSVIADQGTPDNVRQALQAQLKKNSALTAADQLHNALVKDYGQAQADVQNNNTAVQKAYSVIKGRTQPEILGGLTFENGGHYKIGSDGYAEIDPTTQKPIINEPDKQFHGTLDAYFVDPKNPNVIQRVMQDASPKDRDSLYALRSKGAQLKGGSINNAIISQGTEPAPQQTKQTIPIIGSRTAAPAATGGFSGAQTGTGVQKDAVDVAIQQTLQVPDAFIPVLKPEFNKLVTTIDNYSKDIQYRKDPASQGEISTIKVNIGKTLANQQWAESQAVQAKYNKAAVQDYNDSIDKKLQSQSNIPAITTVTPSGSVDRQIYGDTLGSLVEAIRPTTPQELYYMKEVGPIVNAKLKPLIERLMEEGYKKHEALTNNLNYNSLLAVTMAQAANGNTTPNNMAIPAQTAPIIPAATP